MLKKILLQLTDLYNMTCVYYRVVCMYQSNCQLVLALVLRLNTYDKTSHFRIYFSSKMSSRDSWKRAKLTKMLYNNAPLTFQQFDVLLPKFLGEVSALNLLKASCLFKELIQFKSWVKRASHYFYCLNGFTNNILKSVTNLVYTCCYSSLSTNHVGFPIMTLNFTIR